MRFRAVEYYKYVDRAQKKQLMGVEGNAISYPETHQVHSIWPSDNHEVVHVVEVAELGRAISFFSEGIAVALQTNPATGDLVPRWNGEPLDAIARRNLQANTLPPLSDLIESQDKFRGYSQNISYPVAGSFVAYLFTTRGLTKLKSFLGANRSGDSASKTSATSRSVYGEELSDVWQQWRTHLTSL